MSEHYPELASEIDKMELSNPTWDRDHKLALQLRIQLEIAEQLHRIADKK